MGTEIVNFFEEITPQSADQLIGELAERDGAPDGAIKVRMMSPGGDEDAGWAIYDFITNMKSKIDIIGYGQVSSMAVLVLQAARWRALAPHCHLLIHPGEVTPQDSSSSEILALVKNSELLSREYIRVLKTRADQSLKHPGQKIPSFGKFKRWASKETYLTAEQAIKYGLADRLTEKGE